MQRSINPLLDRIALKKIRETIRHDFQPDIVHTHAATVGALRKKKPLMMLGV